MTLLAASPEEKYFETRDNFIREFEKAASTPIDSLTEQDQHALDEQDKRALAELEKQLKPIVGAVNVDGFPKQGKINLETLQNGDLGFGQVDGLRFTANQEYLFVTTDNILKISLCSLRREIEYSQSSRQRQLRSQKFRSVEASGKGLRGRSQTQMKFIDPRA